MPSPEDFDWLLELNAKELFRYLIVIILIIVVATLLSNAVVGILNKFGITTRRQRDTERHIKHISENHEDIKDLTKTVNETVKMINKISPMVREINANINTLNTKFENMNTTTNNIKKRLDIMEVKQENSEKATVETRVANAKDRLYQSYRYYKKRAEETGKKEWTTIESDGFHSLLEDYFNKGGNGNVQNKVVPYMDEFIINDDDVIK